MRRGEVYWINLDGAIGGEIAKTRPAIVLSNNTANRVLNRLVVVPLTTSIDRVLIGEALVTVRGTPQKALASQMRTVSKLRVGKLLGQLTPDDLYNVETAILKQLGFSPEGFYQ